MNFYSVKIDNTYHPTDFTDQYNNENNYGSTTHISIITDLQYN